VNDERRYSPSRSGIAAGDAGMRAQNGRPLFNRPRLVRLFVKKWRRTIESNSMKKEATMAGQYSSNKQFQVHCRQIRFHNHFVHGKLLATEAMLITFRFTICSRALTREHDHLWD
jgi:hypothetical protein